MSAWLLTSNQGSRSPWKTKEYRGGCEFLQRLQICAHVQAALPACVIELKLCPQDNAVRNNIQLLSLALLGSLTVATSHLQRV